MATDVQIDRGLRMWATIRKATPPIKDGEVVREIYDAMQAVVEADPPADMDRIRLAALDMGIQAFPGQAPHNDAKFWAFVERAHRWLKDGDARPEFPPAQGKAA